MNCRSRILLHFACWWLLLVMAVSVHGAETGKLVRRTWNVAGVVREALVFGGSDEPAKPRPLVIVFHGHGGTMKSVAQAFRIHELWPEALVVYPQGLPTAGRLVDREGKFPGWQMDAGDHGDRDLKFFDVVVEQLQREGRVDPARIFVTGHSNGGAFIYLLWAQRGERIAAYASSAAAWFGPYKGLRPARFLMLAGEKDDLVKYAWQRRTFEGLCKHFSCAPVRREASGCLVAEASSGTQIVAYVHPGAHQFPAEAPALIVKFFRMTPDFPDQK
jgi:polyhydroxybutyrate depolymerase